MPDPFRISPDEHERIRSELHSRAERRDGDVVTTIGNHEDHGRVKLVRKDGVFTVEAECAALIRPLGEAVERRMTDTPNAIASGRWRPFAWCFDDGDGHLPTHGDNLADRKHEKIWTVARSNDPSWETDTGCPGFGLTFEIAQWLCDAANEKMDREGYSPTPEPA